MDDNNEHDAPSPAARFMFVCCAWLIALFVLARTPLGHSQLGIAGGVGLLIAFVIGGAVFVAAAERGKTGFDLFAFGLAMAILLALVLGGITFGGLIFFAAGAISH